MKNKSAQVLTTAGRWLTRVALGLVALYLVLFAAGYAVLNVPYVQNKLRPWATEQLSGALGAEVSVGFINLSRLRQLTLEDLYMEDTLGAPLLKAEALRVNLFSIPTLLFVSDNDAVREINVSGIELENALLNLYTEKKSGEINILGIIPDSGPKESGPSKPLALNLNGLSITNMTFRFADSTAAAADMQTKPGKLNYQNLQVESLNLEADLELDQYGGIFLDVGSLQFNETGSGLVVREFASAITLQPEIAREGQAALFELRNTRFKSGTTRLNFDLKMPDESLSTLFKLGRNRKFALDFRESVIAYRTANFFIPEDLPLRGRTTLAGSFTGDYKKLICHNLYVRQNDRSRIHADVRIDNYTNAEQLYIQATVDNTTLYAEDLRSLLPGVNIPPEVERFGRARIDGKFLGFLHDFVSKARFRTLLGNAETDLHIRNDPKTGLLSYKGKLKTQDLNLNRLLDQNNISSRFNFEGYVEGSGASLEELNAEANFQMEGPELSGYELELIEGVASIENQLFKGDLDVLDPKGSFNGKLEINLAEGERSYFLLGDVQNVDLKHYGAAPQPLSLTTIFNVNLKGETLDELSGKARFFELGLTDRPTGRQLNIDNLRLRAEGNSETRKSLEIRSSSLDFDLEGNFSYEEAIRLAQGAVEESELYFKGDSLFIADYYAKKETQRIRFHFDLKTKDLTPALQFFDSTAYVSPGAMLTGNFSFRDQDSIVAALKADSIRYRGFALEQTDVRAVFAKPAKENSFKLLSEASGRNFQLPGGYEIPEIYLQPRLFDDSLNYNISFGNDAKGNYAMIAGEADLAKDGFHTIIYDDYSRIALQDTLWEISGANSIDFQFPDNLKVKNLAFKNGDRLIEVNGHVGEGSEDLIAARIRNFELGLLNQFLNDSLPMRGLVNLDAKIVSPFETPKIDVEGSAVRLAYNDVPLGEMYAVTEYVPEKSNIDAQLKWVKDGDSLLFVTGSAGVSENPTLDLAVKSNGLPLSVLRPFLPEDLIYDLAGKAWLDNVRVTGPATRPEINGLARLDAHFGLAFLKTEFSVNNVVKLRKDRILFEDFALNNRDAKGRAIPGQAVLLNGAVWHEQWQQMQFDLQMREFSNLQVMNTKRKDNPAFYGNVTVQSGQLRLQGDAGGVLITGNGLTAAKGTVVNIPLTDYNEQERLDYVVFTGGTNKDTLRRNSVASAADGSDFEVEFDLQTNITPDATINMIFDEKIGDKITARGKGALELEMLAGQDFQMTGDFEIAQGDYLFTYANVINRRFRVNPGGTLAWTGDPLNARINLTAIYTVEQASLQAWDTTQATTARVNVLMEMKGNLQNPEIEFDIELPNLAQNQSPGVTAIVRQMQQDEQERARQVFSLIALGTVAPPGQFFGQNAAGAGVASSASEFLANQLNNIISQSINKNIGVSVSYAGNQSIVMDLRYSLLNDRLTIERSGAISSGQNRDITLGNINIQYRLLPNNKASSFEKGALSAEIFNRETTGANNTVTSTRGGGLFYRQSFDIFKRKRRKESRKDAPPPEPGDQPAAPPGNSRPETEEQKTGGE